MGKRREPIQAWYRHDNPEDVKVLEYVASLKEQGYTQKQIITAGIAMLMETEPDLSAVIQSPKSGGYDPSLKPLLLEIIEMIDNIQVVAAQAGPSNDRATPLHKSVTGNYKKLDFGE